MAQAVSRTGLGGWRHTEPMTRLKAIPAGAGKKPVWPAPIGALALLLCMQAARAEVPTPATVDASDRALPVVESGWMLGVSAANGPSRPGASGRENKLRPVLAGKLGRWTVSTSSARRLNSDGLAGGVSTTLATQGQWSAGFGLRLTQGRSADGDPLLEGLSNVRSSLAARVSARYAFTPTWNGVAQWQQDVLRAQGGRANLGLTARWPLGGGWTLDAGSGVSWLNHRAMQTFYGVPLEAARPGRTAHLAGAGLEQLAASVGATWVVDRHWRVSTALTASRLLGDAAASPLTVRRSSNSLQFTVAYAGW